MDRVSAKKRSEIMASVKSENTGPEITVRKLVFGLGYRYRLHSKKLPGKPDLVFASKKKVIFVNGCFWHGHRCKKGRIPKSNMTFWIEKIENNKKRDKKVKSQLKRMGWQSLTIWQCQLGKGNIVREAIIDFLECDRLT